MRLLAAVILCFLSVPLYAQTTVSGKVTDGKGIEIPGANVTLKDTYDGASTDDSGNYSFVTYEEGLQVLSISYIGFEAYEDSIELTGGQLVKDVILQEEISSLRTVVITAGAFEASDEKKAVVLRPLDIVTTAGAGGDIAGALNTLPGTTTVGEEGTLFVRGGESYETKQFIDGLLVQNPYSAGVPDVPSRGRFSPFLFKGTIFSTGGYSAEYGQALSSALILNSQDLAPRDNIGISLTPLSWGLSQTKAWEKTSLSLSANYGNLKPYFEILKQNVDWERPPEFGGGELIFRQKTSKTGLFKLYSTFSSSRQAIRYQDLLNETSGRFASKAKRTYVNTSLQEILGDKWTLYLGAGFSCDKDDFDPEIVDVGERLRSAQAKTTLSRILNDDVRIKFGTEVLSQQYKLLVTEKETEQEYTNTKLKESFAAAFVESDIYLTNKLIVRLGLRGEYSNLLDDQSLMPRLSLAYKTGEYSQVSLAYGQFYQSPGYDILRADHENLGFEKADHYIANYQLIKDKRTFRVESYYKQYKNLIRYSLENELDFLLVDQSYLDIQTPANNGEGYARGLDLFYRDQKSIKDGDFWISYSFLDSERQYLYYPIKAVPRFVSSHNLSIVYKHYFAKLRTQLGATLTYGSPRPYYNPNDVTFHDSRTPAFKDLSVNASYLTSIKGNFTVVYASLSNVPGFNNIFGYRYSADGSARTAIEQPNKRFFFLGCFISIGN